jgi:genome maintenance exonuclease 1
MKTTATIHGIRHYLIDGVWMPSVTGILSATGNKAGLHQWRKSVGAEQANQLSRQACDRGTTIHQFCERRLRGYRAAAKVPDALKPYWASLQPVLISSPFDKE